MKKYDVVILFTHSKKYTVEASNGDTAMDNACVLAHEEPNSLMYDDIQVVDAWEVKDGS